MGGAAVRRLRRRRCRLKQRGRGGEEAEGAYAQVFVGSLSLLLAGLMAFMLRSHREAPLWLVSELFAVLCHLLYLWAYHVTQNLTPGATVPMEVLVFSFPLVLGAGFLAALLAVAVGPVAGVFAEYVGYKKLPAEHKKAYATIDSAASTSCWKQWHLLGEQN